MDSVTYYRFEIASILRQYPILFNPLIKISNRLRRSSWPKYVEKNSEMVIEGYFRSGNTFALRAFSEAQGHKVKMACHTHAIATVKLAIKWDLPTLILIRKPEDTVVSATLKAPGTTLGQHLRWYLRYYEKIYQLRHNLYIALFEDVTRDFGAEIQKANNRFGTRFAPFEHTPENVSKVFDWIERIDRHIYQGDLARYSVPMAARETLKEVLKAKLNRHDSSYLWDADQLYQKIKESRLLT